MGRVGLRGIAGGVPLRAVRRRTAVVAGALVVLLVASSVVLRLSELASGAGGSRCDRFTAASTARARAVTGPGRPVLVIGDSYSAGLGLADAAASWPARLPGSVHVAGFSGSGFSPGGSECRGVSFADRAPGALRGGTGHGLVVVEGGLNDFDQPDAAIEAGFARLMAELRGHRVVIVGPVSPPPRAGGVPRGDALLASLARRYGAGYVRTSAWALPSLDDRLHLTPAGHRAFGDAVAARRGSPAPVTAGRPAP